MVRKQVGFLDRKNENTPNFPSIEIWYLAASRRSLKINLSYLELFKKKIITAIEIRGLKYTYVLFEFKQQNFLLLKEVICETPNFISS